MAARAGDFDAAASAAEALRQAVDRGRASESDYRYALGAIAFARGEFDQAAEEFDKAATRNPVLWNHLPLARSYLEAGRVAEAVDVFDKILNRYDYGWFVDAIGAATMHYYAGIAYERSGWTDRAIERYEEFLTIWQDADPGLEMVDDARQRLERLRRGS
jgi:tetratricopeptide (TPR) repeat protein